MNSLVNLTANATGNFLNTYSMRRTEMQKGIEVFRDEQMTDKVGISKICA